MLVRSLALTTELALAATRGKVTDRGDYIVVETPDDPGYYHGNLLVLPAAPQVGEVAYWTRRFESELGGNPAIRHVTFWWDGITGDAGAEDELKAAGFVISRHQLMAAEWVEVQPASLEICRLTSTGVLATADLAWTIGDRHDERYRQFLYRRAAWQQTLVSRGEATFWGAFDDGKLVASLGLVPLGEVARYQDVQTLSSHRKRGLASALLATAAQNAAQRVVIIAEQDSEAARVYSRLGFRTIERSAHALKSPA